MTKNIGLIRRGTGRAIFEEIPTPQIRPDEILVDAPGDDGTLVGCDYAGYVLEVGKAVKREFKKGDRICGFSHGGTESARHVQLTPLATHSHLNTGNDARPETGAFARQIVVKGDIQFHIPDHITFEAACTVGCGLMTATLALHKFLDLPFPASTTNASGAAINGSREHPTVLIYGGSTATGTLAIQLAKLSGANVLTTASPKNMQFVESLGADRVFDHTSCNIASQIREATNDQLALVFDCVSIDSTATICAEAIGSNVTVAKYVNLLDVPCPRADVDSIFFLAYGASGEAYIFEGEHYPAEPSYHEHVRAFAPIAEKLWAEGKLREHPQRLEGGGLQGAIEGMRVMKEGRYSGEKLVYRMEDTVEV
ncbi:Protein TOXD [Cyphellophora attinorum]|uniref:Protein TOXD n=1 Tax=Cyphellophora attinorum TaxID=1664694 RepID=A0A0N0NIM4_9EURO|nr:Protein TOXD [Phialophora attinorum]KPI36001.1 Protein TOXD [Phialophora attinorum]